MRGNQISLTVSIDIGNGDILGSCRRNEVHLHLKGSSTRVAEVAKHRQSVCAFVCDRDVEFAVPIQVSNRHAFGIGVGSQIDFDRERYRPGYAGVAKYRSGSRTPACNYQIELTVSVRISKVHAPGAVPAVKSIFPAREIAPDELAFRKMETVVALKFGTARSGFPSPSRSPMATSEYGPAPVEKSSLFAKVESVDRSRAAGKCG